MAVSCSMPSQDAPGIVMGYKGTLGYLDRGMAVSCSIPSQDVPGIVMGN